MKLTSIYRAGLFSPHQHAENDRLILESTARYLEQNGFQISFLSEEQVTAGVTIESPLVISMCQGQEANIALLPIAQEGTLIINSPASVLTCHRQSLFPFLGPSCELVPLTFLVSTAFPDQRYICDGETYWIKRGDVHATQDGDVVRVDSLGDCERVLRDFRRRNIRNAVIQKHVEGKVVKFYGVVSSGFFRFHSEEDPRMIPAFFQRNRRVIETLVRRVGLEIYGGDAVVRPDGSVVIIDINDWPSYACYRQEAAYAIGEYVLQQAFHHEVVWQSTSSHRPPALAGD